MFFLSFLEALALTAALSADAFISAFAYGADKVKVPFKSCVVISIVCTAMLTMALAVGDLVSGIIPISMAIWISFFIFVIIGSIKILSPIIKRRINKAQNTKDTSDTDSHTPFKNTENFSGSQQSLRRLSLVQSVVLAVALSLDGLGIGFGAGLNAPNFILIAALSLITNGIAIALGALLGNKLSSKIRFSLSWLSGVVLIAIGIVNVLF